MKDHSKEILLPKLIAWEVTRSCELNCWHCRAAARNQTYKDELTAEQCFRLLDNIAGFAKPIMILTGGEPMLREDIFDIARYGRDLGLRMVMAPCGALITDQTVMKMLDSGIQCISISLDGATAVSHDRFRGVTGAFDIAVKAVEVAKRHGLPFQINTTITKHNLDEFPDILELAEKMGAITFNPFLLVPTGRGKDLADQEISPEQYEEVLQWLSEPSIAKKIPIRVTCAPHYQRILRQKKGPDSACCHASGHGQSEKNGKAFASGCMGGKSFAFISHTGKVQICGFLEEAAGDLKLNDLDFCSIWNNSNLFQSIRDVNNYNGKCGICEYRRLCGGCRARAFAMTGNYLDSEPYCIYQPRADKKT